MVHLFKTNPTTASLIFFLTFFFAADLGAQAPDFKVDSLTTALEKATDPSEKSELLVALGDVYAQTNPDRALTYGRRLLELESAREPSYGLASAYRLMEDIYTRKGLVDSSIFYLKKLCALLPELPDQPKKNFMLLNAKKDLAASYNQTGRDQEAIDLVYEALAIPGISTFDSITAYNNLGNSFFEVSRYDESIAMFQKVLDYTRQHGEKRLEAMALVNSTMSLDALGRYDLSEDYLKKAITIVREINEEVGLAFALRNLAFLYSVTGRKQESRDTMWSAIQQSIKIGNLDMQADNIGSSLSLQDSTMAKDPKLVAMAEEFLQPGSPNLESNKVHLHSTLAKYFVQTKEYNDAAYHATEGLTAMQAIGKDSTMDYLFLIENLAIAQQQTGQYKEAAANFRKVKDLFKIIKAKNDEAAYAETAVKMELTENKLSLERAEAAVALEQQASAARNRLFGIAALAAALILAVLVWAYRRSRKDAARITEQKTIVEQSLSEKEVLLREIHHRVKNNLQIISGMLNKQARIAANPDLQKMVDEGKERIQSMALIHQNLYESEQLSGVNIRAYLEELGQNISNSQAGNSIKLELDVANETLDLDTAIPVGLILNELLTNSYKYAFPEQQSGKVIVGLKKQADDSYELRVSDNGVGIVNPARFESGKTLGVNLVRGLVRQLRGTVEWLKPERGTEVKILFQPQTA